MPNDAEQQLLIDDSNAKSLNTSLGRLPSIFSSNAHTAHGVVNVSSSISDQNLRAEELDSQDQQTKLRSSSIESAASFLLVYERSERLRGLYKQTKGRFFDDVIFYDCPEKLARDRRYLKDASLIIFNVCESNQASTHFVPTICESFPDAGILLTAKSGVVEYLDDVAAISDKIQILPIPFSFMGLMSKLKQYQKPRAGMAS